MYICIIVYLSFNMVVDGQNCFIDNIRIFRYINREGKNARNIILHYIITYTIYALVLWTLRCTIDYSVCIVIRIVHYAMYIHCMPLLYTVILRKTENRVCDNNIIIIRSSFHFFSSFNVTPYDNRLRCVSHMHPVVAVIIYYTY